MKILLIAGNDALSMLMEINETHLFLRYNFLQVLFEFKFEL